MQNHKCLLISGKKIIPENKSSPPNSTLSKENPVAGLNISLTINPDAINAGQKFDVLIILKNSGITTVNIDTLELLPPWEFTRSPENGQVIMNGSIINKSDHLTLSFGTIIPISGKVTVPPGSFNGIYKIGLLTKGENLSDRLISSNIIIKKFDSLPLTGNIPFSILFLVIAGGIMYFTYNIASGRKAENKYEWVFSTASLGFVLWYALYYLIPYSNISNLEIISGNLNSVMVLLISAFVIGLSAGGIKKFVIDKVNRHIEQWKEERTQKLNLMRKGYAEEDQEHILLTSIKEKSELVTRRVGNGYRPVLTVCINMDISDNENIITGVLKRATAEGDIELSPKYIFLMSTSNNEGGVSNFQAIINIIFSQYKYSAVKDSSKESPMELELRQDKMYLNHIIKYLKLEHDIESDYFLIKDYDFYKQIAQNVKDILNKNILDTDKFVKILYEIDFSRLVKYVANDYDRRNKKPLILYETKIISKELIKWIQINSYETRDFALFSRRSNNHSRTIIYEGRRFHVRPNLNKVAIN